MMKTLSLIIVCLVCLNTTAQTNDSTLVSGKSKRFMIGFSFSPDYAYRTLYNKTGDDDIDNDIQNSNDVNKARLGYTTGFALGYQASSKWTFDIGVFFSKKGYTYKPSSLVYGDIIDPRKGFIYATTEVPNSIRIIYGINYLDVPVRAIYTCSKGKLKWQVGAGVCTSFSLYSSNNFIANYPTEKTTRQKRRYDNYVDPIMVSPILSFGSEFKLSDKLIFRAEPTFRYAINPIYESQIEKRLWSAGLNLSCYYKFQ